MSVGGRWLLYSVAVDAGKVISFLESFLVDKMGIVIISKLLELRIKQDHVWTPTSTVAGHRGCTQGLPAIYLSLHVL